MPERPEQSVEVLSEDDKRRLQFYLGVLLRVKSYRDEIPENKITSADPFDKTYKCQLGTFHDLIMAFGALKQLITEEDALQRIAQFEECVAQLKVRRRQEIEEAVVRGVSTQDIANAGRVNQAEVDEVNSVCDYFIEYINARLGL